MSTIETQPRSVSQTQQYEDCAWRFYLQRVERVVPRPAAWGHHGTAFHSAAEDFELSGRTMGAEEVVQRFSDLYSDLVNKSLDQEPDTGRWLSAGRVSGGEDIERRYVLGQEQTARYVEWAKEAGPDIWLTPANKPAVELYFMVEIGGVSVRGYIDQLTVEPDDSLRVRDLKTGTMKSRFQLETYKVAVEKSFNVPVNKGDWYLAKNGGLSRTVKLDQVTDEQVGDRFAAMDAGVKRGDFPARPDFHCRFCDVSHACSFKQ
ncbi:PD-(D/E)XK nuclease family protein [Streptomyces sp. NPDC058861]|uniref:PD-(D/E)XK nuclease family protein n=1 Tax=Streptomyces sp. NPDC058861 TaxID=3346653 RepID=UPI0036CED9D8